MNNIVGPMVWNSLPDELRDPACDSGSFKQFLYIVWWLGQLSLPSIQGMQIEYQLTGWG